MKVFFRHAGELLADADNIPVPRQDEEVSLLHGIFMVWKVSWHIDPDPFVNVDLLTYTEARRNWLWGNAMHWGIREFTPEGKSEEKS